jgi:saccharopine dehydrogenase-like NADP-dependent oxidoreductase
MQKVLVLGAGNIGQAIARLLQRTGDYAVRVADSDPVKLARLGSDVTRFELDAADPEALAPALTEVGTVISACPYYLNTGIARVARATGTDYFDLTEDVSTTRAVREIALDASNVFVPQCGLAPGFISIAAHALTTRFEALKRVRMRVGALPLFPSNALKYNLTWSTAGLINEYCNPCEVIYDGELREVMPLEGYEQFSLDGVSYEAFNTSGGLGTLCETLAGQVENLNYKTIRYPGHCELMKFLCQELQLCDRRDLFLDVLEHAVPITAQDVVLIFVTVSGLRDGQLVQETYTRKVYHGAVDGRPMAAIQLTTAAAVCAMVDLHREGKLPKTGFVRQEQTSLEDFLKNRFGRLYEHPP